MNTLNRHLLIVRCRQPYLDWANTSCGDGPMLEESREKYTAYLVDARESDVDGSKAIRDSWSEIFEDELAAWSTDGATWPKARTVTMFRAWFDGSFTTIVADLGRGRIEVDED